MIRRNGRTVLAAVGLVAVLALGGCSAGPAEPAGPAAQEGRAAGQWEAEGEATTAPPRTVAPAPSLAPVGPEEVSLAPRVMQSDAPAQIIAVTATEGEDLDLLTFTFAPGSVPGYDIRYVDRLERGVDDVVMLDGEAVLTVTLTNSRIGADSSAGADALTNAAFDLPVVRQVLLAENLGGTVTFGVGLAGQAPFAVSISESSLVLAFPHGGD